MNYFAERMRAFRDSREVASMVRAEAEDNYACAEAQVHILGLWGLCIQLYRENRRLLKALALLDEVRQ